MQPVLLVELRLESYPFVVQLGVMEQDSTHVGVQLDHHTNVPVNRETWL